MDVSLPVLAAGIAATSAPLVFAALGETLTEKAGVINLSPDGTILLAAMTGIPSQIFQVAPFPLMIFTFCAFPPNLLVRSCSDIIRRKIYVFCWMPFTSEFWIDCS